MRMLSAPLLVLALGGLVAAQTAVSAPFDRAGDDVATGLPRLQPRASAIAALAAPALGEQITLRQMPLPGGETRDLDLRRIDLGRLGLRFFVDGQPAPGLLAGLDLSLWTGSVHGAPDSEACLAFGQRGVRGWIRQGQDLVHLMPQPGDGGDWTNSHVLLAREDELAARGVSLGSFCAAERIQPMTRPQAPPAKASAGAPEGSAGCTYWECEIAIETDFQLFQVFGDLGAEVSYVTTLLGAVSDRYEEQIDTVLLYPYVQFYTTAADPWGTPESGGSMLDMLDEFEAAWAGSVPGGARLGHFVSGANLGGGVAYLGALCDTSQTFSFAVSGNIDGLVPFPVQQGPLNWDFVVFAHETGHNFNSPHTHDYVPPLDTCPSGNCISNGTIMSYCHQCPGGMSNITTYFQEPTNTDLMKAHAAACLPFFAPVVPQASPTLISAGVATALSVDALGTPVGGVDLHWRHGPGDPFTMVPMTNQGGGVWTGSLPAPDCGDQPEWYFSTIDAVCGAYQTAVSSAEVGFETLLLVDELEVNSGWTAGVLGDDASTGIWVRSDPIGTAAQPENDVSNPGVNCFFTGQGTLGGTLGEADVDGGTTTLLSPLLDLSAAGDVRIGYWRWYSNDTGGSPNADVFVVDVSNNGGTNWTNVETVGPSGAGTGGGWIWHQFTLADFVTPSASVRLRFVASDLGSGSLVEAAVDGLRVFRIDCSPWQDLGGGTSGINGPLLLEMSGPLTPASLVTLDFSNGAPNALAVIFISFSSTPTPFLGGTLHTFPIDELLVLSTSPAGAIFGSAFFVGAASGVQIWFQVGVVDASVPLYGASLSNAVVGTVP